ncbi:MAG: FAD/NAD(P)-binding oxidoreductase [Candidatus Omnitrophica bacterium]|nr:FAD/NAD(P)-binding oxidoreductase [Candidatus Omnitrophota bacterium]
MKHITVLGAGVAGLALIGKLKEKIPDIKITLIDKELCHFNKREVISALSFARRIDLPELCSKMNVEFIQARVEKINPARKKIYCKDRDSLDFETLVIATGTVSRQLSIKGDHREGFFYCADIEPRALKDLLKISAEATVNVSTMVGLRLACALRSLGKEVKVVTGTWEFLGEYKDRVTSFLQGKNITLYNNSQIEEAIGEGMVKAVKIAPLKVFSSQLVFIDSGFKPARDFFEEEVKIKDIFFTEFEGVHFLGDAGRNDLEDDFFYAFNDQDAAAQASCFADYLLGGAFPAFSHRILDAQGRNALLEDFLSMSVTANG